MKQKILRIIDNILRQNFNFFKFFDKFELILIRNGQYISKYRFLFVESSRQSYRVAELSARMPTFFFLWILLNTIFEIVKYMQFSVLCKGKKLKIFLNHAFLFRSIFSNWQGESHLSLLFFGGRGAGWVPIFQYSKAFLPAENSSFS